MASAFSTVSFVHSPASVSPFKAPRFRPWIQQVPSYRCFFSSRTANAPPLKASSSGSPRVEDNREPNEEHMDVDALQQFIQLNLGRWTGTFYQFDCLGNLMRKISTKLAVGSYGEDELISLIQTLYIKQPPSATSISGVDDEPEWFEYKIKETNMFTVDKYQQIGFFPKERAFALRYQTAGMLETILRQGVLGEDDTGEESPKNLKLPSRRPSIVCENCLYSLENDRRVRAFHIMDPQGFLDMLLVFLEERNPESTHMPPFFDDSQEERLNPHLGTWKGYSVTKRSGVYGATIAKADTVSILEMTNEGQLIQDITSTSDGRDVTTNVHWTGNMSKNVITFDGGFQLNLLPGGIYMGYPCDIRKSVQETKSFHLELCWLESPGKRQRLVRTYDVEGLAVSSTYFFETRVRGEDITPVQGYIYTLQFVNVYRRHSRGQLLTGWDLHFRQQPCPASFIIGRPDLVLSRIDPPLIQPASQLQFKLLHELISKGRMGLALLDIKKFPSFFYQLAREVW